MSGGLEWRQSACMATHPLPTTPCCSTSTASSRPPARCSRVLEGDLRRRAREAGPFDIERDYLAHVDGKRRTRRRARLPPLGRHVPEPVLVRRIADAQAGRWWTGAGSRRRRGVPGSVRWVQHLRAEGVRPGRGVVEHELPTRCCGRRRSTPVRARRRRRRRGPARPARQARARRLPRGGRAGSARRRARGGGRGRAAGVAAGRRRWLRLVIGVARGDGPPGCARRCGFVVGDLGELVRMSPRARAQLRDRRRAPTTGGSSSGPPRPRAPPAHESVFAVGERLPRRARHARGGRPAHDAGVIAQRLPRDVADRLPRGRLRARPHRADDRQRHRRLGHPPVRRRRAVRPRDGALAALRAHARHADRRAVTARSSSRRARRRIAVRSRRLASLEHRHLAALDYEVVALDGRREVATLLELVTPRAEAGGRPAAREGVRRGVLVPVAARARGQRAPLQLATRNSGLSSPAGWTTRSCGRGPVTRLAEGDGAAFVVLADLRPGTSLRLSKFVAYHWGRAAPPATWSRGWTARSTARCATATTWSSSTTAAPRRGVLAPQRRRARGRAGRPAGGALQPVPAPAGDGPRRGPRRPGQGRHRPRLRGPLLLGHRDLRRPVPRPHDPAVGAAGARVPLRDARRRRASGRARSATAARSSRGARSAARRRRPGTRPARRSTTSTPTSPTRCTTTTGSPATSASCSSRAPRCWWRRRGFWMDLGFFSERRDGRFCINGVTGPDEYTTVVDNNAYTNLMAKENLEVAARVVEWLFGADPEAYAGSCARPGSRPTRSRAGGARPAAMYVPRHEELGIVLQDEHFLERKPWDFDGHARRSYPLLLHYHPLELYRHQVIKQTDVVLATYLVGHAFSEEEKRRTFDYYDPLTTGDSTLSACVQSVIASEVGYADAALEYFLDACRRRPARRPRQHRRRHPRRVVRRHLARARRGLRRAARRGRARGDFAPRLPAEWDGRASASRSHVTIWSPIILGDGRGFQGTRRPDAPQPARRGSSRRTGRP